MPTPKNLESYPPEFEALLKKVCRVGAKAIPCGNKASAQALRNDLYNYRNQLRRAAVAYEDEETCRLALLFDPLQLSINGPNLLIIDTEAETFLSEIVQHE